MSKRKALAVVIGAAVFAIVGASAATLGGIQTNDLGANSNTVKGHVTQGVALSWDTEYSASLNAYVVTGMELTPVSASETIDDEAEVKVTLVDSSGGVLGEWVSTDGGATWDDVPAVAITAASVVRASVVINGGSVTSVASITP